MQWIDWCSRPKAGVGNGGVETVFLSVNAMRTKWNRLQACEITSLLYSLVKCIHCLEFSLKHFSSTHMISPRNWAELVLAFSPFARIRSARLQGISSAWIWSFALMCNIAGNWVKAGISNIDHGIDYRWVECLLFPASSTQNFVLDDDKTEASRLHEASMELLFIQGHE